MERLPFDPRKARGANAANGSSEEPNRPLSVAQLATHIEGALRDGLPLKLSVRGEISGFKNQTHWYFTLKDSHAVIGCVMFASAARRQKIQPRNGDEVVLTGRVEFWGKGGRVQFYADAIEPVGQGSLEQRYQRLIAELRGLGWFELERKRPLPTFPKRVAVVTSRTGAALQDVIDTANRRCPSVELCTVDVRVQGEAAAPQVSAAIDWLSTNHGKLGIDAIILTRGGGSLEDLWAFNERVVAQSIVDCSVPVVAAIGHETDTTIAELVADERCATPTQAVMRLLPDAAALLEQVHQLGRRLDARLSRMLAEERRHFASLTRRPAFVDRFSAVASHRQLLGQLGARLKHCPNQISTDRTRRLFALSERLSQHRPRTALDARLRRLDVLSFRLKSAMRSRLRTSEHTDRFDQLHNAFARHLERLSDRTNSLGRELEVVSPLRILARGYTVTTDDDGRLLRTASEAQRERALITRFADGTVRTVRPTIPIGPEARPSSHATGSTEPAASVPKEPVIPRPTAKTIQRRHKRPGHPPSDQMGLFGG
ncbi:MAG: exodeoxyribonuclease VII large subunit [Phycisphaerales bacterium]